MAENTEQKIKNLQFKRNKTIFSSFDELVATVKDPAFLRKTEIVEMQDGELLMFRYKDSTGNIATLVGSVYSPDSTTKEIHLEIGTNKIKKIIQEELKNIGDNQSKITINSADKILSLGSDNILTANLNLVKSGDTLKLIGKNNLVISTITLPKSESTINSLSFNWLPQEAKLQLISNDNVLSEVDFPFETMVQSSELTTDNKLKLVFNTTKGPQSVIVDLNKLKDIYTAGDSTISVTGNKISTKVSSKTTSLPITKETDGLWVNDVKLTETVNDLNLLKAKVNSLEAGSGSGDSESNKPKNPTGVNLLFVDTAEFYNNSLLLQRISKDKQCVLPLKPITLDQAEQVFTFSFDLGNTTTEMFGWLGIALVDEYNEVIPLTIFLEGNLDVQEAWSDDGDSTYKGVYLNLTKIKNNSLLENTEYSSLRRLFISFGFKDSNAHTVKKLILYNNREPNEFFIGSIGDPILEFGTIPSDYSIKRHEYEVDKTLITNDIISVTRKVKNIENNPVSSGDSTIEVTNNKISTKISKTGGYIPLVKKDDGLFVDDSDYKNLLSKVAEIDTKVNIIENNKIPNLSDTEKADIIEVYVGFDSGPNIKNLVLGKGLKEPYNFVISYNGGSYDPTYNISDSAGSTCMGTNKTFYGIIESMDYLEWLHDCNIDPNNFNNNSYSVIKIKNCYIPTSLSIKNDSERKQKDMLFAGIQQFVQCFKYDFKGNIWKVDYDSTDFWSFKVNSDSSEIYTYGIYSNSYVFLDSTLFFNKSMQGKYIPFMWDNKLWYFHFNADLDKQ